MIRRTILAVLALLISFSALSAPARRGSIRLVQPDGISFSARIMGDEFMKIMMTEGGNAIIMDEGGWWCYAHYDAGGAKISSGHRVGRETPAEIMSMSRIIPYGKLAANAGAKRAALTEEVEPLMSRVLKYKGIDTRADAEGPVTKHGIIILAQFNDEKFTYTREDFINMLTKDGYKSNGATGSAKEYFDSQFNGLFDFSFDVSPIVTLPQNMAHYGGNKSDDSDNDPQQMVIDACRLSDNDIDFSLYDDDGDGKVDNVFIFFAGGDEAEGAGSDRIWSHAWQLTGSKDLILDGKKIERYACTAELTRKYTGTSDFSETLAGIGTFCHEYFHTFGIPDMYDTDYDGSGGTAAGLWESTSLMDAGNQNNYGNTPPNLNAIEREFLGISEPVLIDSNGGYTLEPVHLNGRTYRLNTDNEDEYYLLECRAEEGWDKYIGGRGMLVYHIDKSDRNAGSSDSYGSLTTARQSWNIYNEVNSRPAHQCADLIEADCRQDGFSATEEEAHRSSLRNIRGVFFPCSAANSLLPGEKPGITYWSGAASSISITNIRETEGGVAFNVLGFAGAELPPAVATHKTEAFMDAAIIRFESDREFEGEAVVTWGKADEAAETVHVKPYEPGKYSITLEGLQPNNKTYTVRIHFELDGIVGEESKVSFMTKKTPAVSWPFIYMGGAGRNSDGSLPSGSKLPLRVYNAADAAEITWTFNGSAVRAGGDGYLTVTKSGTLKAHIIREDGSEETIMKEIIIGEDGK